MKKRVPHQMLLANAGSGKTYALTSRMITLLALDIEPRKIAALTFTKKAAGEFLDAVFDRLADAALDPQKLEQLRSDTGTSLDAAHCQTILRRMVNQLGGLCMGTIDSLFAKIARAFPFESGLTGEFSMLGDQALEAAREEALAELFRQESKNLKSFATFLDLVRQQSRKASERQVFETLLNLVKTLHGKILATPPDMPWGDPSDIWPNGSPVLSAGAPAPAAEALRVAIETTHPNLSEAAAESWRTQLNFISSMDPQTPWSKELEKFVSEKLCKATTDKKTGAEYVPMGNGAAARVYLNDPVKSARTNLLLALIKPEFESLLKRSAALHAIMRSFEGLYDRLTRRQGRLTFGDITDLLARLVEEPEWQATVAYRLDTRFDHWMLDEFQDTSRPQWRVLSAFIDEVVQDADSDRSLFYVGDTKQAIYSWRGGDPRLFFEIFNHYKDGDTSVIEPGELADSYRSAREIIDVVNDVFGDIASVQEELELPEAVVDAWGKAWREHKVASPNLDKTGYVRWTAVLKENDEEHDAQDLEILKILEEVQPWARGLSCAVLKSKNDAVSALAGLLQAHGIPVAAEGKSNPCTDNPLGQALLAAFRLAATPEDSLAEVLLAGFPIGKSLLREGPPAFRESALQSLAENGYAATIRKWIGDLQEEPFLESRAEAFLKAASEFDDSRSAADGIFQFLDFVRGHSITESESPDVVRVMTVHQAKGLTFDITIVSGLDGRAQDSATDSIFLGPEPARMRWGMLLPKKDFASVDPVLAKARESLTAETEYGKLCSAYVAMTRPRFGLYVVTNALGAKSTAKNFARLLELTLPSNPFESGSANWFERWPVLRSERDAKQAMTLPLPPPIRGTPQPTSPSALKSLTIAHPSDAPRSQDPVGLGTEVHAQLARIEWLPAPKFPDVSAEARSLIEHFLASAAAKSIFSKPETPTLLWREKAFDVMVADQWTSGIFDRVHIHTDPLGLPVSATVFDFKTDFGTAENLAARYEGQMEAYRRAAAALLGLPEKAVEARVVPVRG